MKIIIVDDRQENLYMLETLLTAQGYEISTASNGQEAFEKLKSDSFGMIISDILMPVMDGFQLCRLCTEDAQLKQVPFVFYTATYVDEKDEAFAYGIGADRFIRKPAEPDVFVKIIQEVIDNAAKDNLEPKACVERKEEDTFKIYSERLVRKLEKKMLDLEKELSMRKKAEQSLEESEERFRLSFDNANIGMALLDLEGRFLTVNKKMCDIFGYNREELENMTVSDVTHPEDLDISLTFIQRAVSGQVENTAFDKKYIHKHGHTLWGKVASSIVRNIKGVPQYFITHIQDISEQKQSEKALNASEEKYRLVVENANDPIFIVQDKNIIFFNKKTTELIGGNAADLANTPFIEFVHPKYRDNVLKMYKSVLNGENPDSSYQFIIVNKSGKELWVELSTVQLFWEEKPAFLNILRDLTHQKKVEAQIVQAQKMESIGSLAGGIAHDFNNILSPILGHTELLLMDTPEDSLSIGNLKAINTAALRAKDLVKQILTFSRQDSSELILIKMQPLVKEALKLIRSAISKTIEIKYDINPDGGIIRADPTQIHQIVMNLVTNACHAMEETGGDLRVGLKEIEIDKQDMLSQIMEPGVYACLTIADTGIGMNKELTQKIFDPFFTTKAKGKGTGMGLSVVYGIVNKMGGTIRVYSEPGKGSEFKVYFPVDKRYSKEQSVQPKEPIPCGNEQILLVDDEEPILTMEKQVLERLGYQVTSRTSSLEALEAFRANPDRFDLVITDTAMPNMPGDKLSGELIKIRPDIPILLCTGFSQTMSEEKAASLGIKGFLFKPMVMRDLAQKIREVLEDN